MNTVVIPAYNEAKTLEDTVKEVRTALPDSEIIIVDDGSIDNTYKIAKKIEKRMSRIKIIKHSENQGKGVALKAGYKIASGNIILTIDSDYTYPSNELPKLIDRINEGYDLVVGSRFKGFEFPSSLPIYRTLANIAGAFFISIIIGKTITDLTSGMRAFRKEITKIPIKAKGLDYESELTTRAISKGYNYSEVKISNFKRRKTKSKLKFFSGCFSFFIAALRGMLKS